MIAAPLVLLGAAVIGVGVAELNVAQQKARAAEKGAHEAERGLAFACGYLYGQRGIISAARLPMQPPEPMTSCPAEMDNAAAHGFTQAAKNERKIQP